jgi:hypothetical protein
MAPTETQARLSRCLRRLLRQVCQQGSDVPKVRRVQPLCEPAVDRPQQVPGNIQFPLTLPQPPQAQRGA